MGRRNVIECAIAGIMYLFCISGSGAIVCNPGYNCRLPDAPVKPFKTVDVPQMVLLTFDGSLQSYISQRLFNANRRNPDGCPISMTIFIDHNKVNVGLVTAEVQRSMDVSILGNIRNRNRTRKDLYNEIDSIQNAVTSSMINPSRFPGWRGTDPALAGNRLFNALEYKSFLYDSTLHVARPQDASTFQWPFTLSNQWSLPPCDARGRNCDEGDFPNLWEFPVTSLVSGNSTCFEVSQCRQWWTPDDVRDLLLENFRQVYGGNRAPFMVKIRSNWLRSNSKIVDGLEVFLEQMNSLSDVYVVSIEKAVRWLEYPTPVNQLSRFVPWECPLRAPSLRNSFVHHDPKPDPYVPPVASQVSEGLNFKSRRDKVNFYYSRGSLSGGKHSSCFLSLVFSTVLCWTICQMSR